MLDKALKEGELLEFGYFPNGRSGYTIDTGEPKDELMGRVLHPFIEIDVQEIVPYETGKEIFRGVIKAKAEAMAAMKG